MLFSFFAFAVFIAFLPAIVFHSAHFIISIHPIPPGRRGSSSYTIDIAAAFAIIELCVLRPQQQQYKSQVLFRILHRASYRLHINAGFKRQNEPRD